MFIRVLVERGEVGGEEVEGVVGQNESVWE
jgi:hypothetical protein